MDPEGSAAKGVSSGAILDEMLRPVYQRDAFLPAQGLSFAIEESVAEVRPTHSYAHFAGARAGFSRKHHSIP